MKHDRYDDDRMVLAAFAMQALVARERDMNQTEIARLAVQYADSLIAALKRDS